MVMRTRTGRAWQGAGSTLAVLNSEIPWDLSLLNLTISCVWWQDPIAPQRGLRLGGV